MHIFLTSQLDGEQKPASHIGCLTSGDIVPITYRRGSWLSSVAGLVVLERKKYPWSSTT